MTSAKLSSLFLGLSALCSFQLNAAVSLSSGYYTENFDAALNAAAWTLSEQTVGTTTPVTTKTLAIRSYADGGRATVTGTGGGENQVSTRLAPEPAGVTFPLTSKVTVSSYAANGFSGGWLTNSGSLQDTAGTGIANGVITATRTATLSFNSLATHTQINSISFLLGAGDSIDTGEGVFAVLLDGNTIFRRDFGSGGGIESGSIAGYGNVGASSTITALATNANLKNDGFYREYWLTGAATADDRAAEGWTLESAYRINLTNLAHTSSTMELQFVWYGMNGDYPDEFISIDNLVIAVPEPSRVLLFTAGFVALLFRRKRG